MNDSDEILAVKAAELYYDDGQDAGRDRARCSASRDGRSAGCSRRRVSRASSASRSCTRAPAASPSSASSASATASTDAVVVPTIGRRDSDVQARVAQAAADYLTTLRPVPRTLGVSWGRTLDAVAAQLATGLGRPASTVVQINGGVSRTRQADRRGRRPRSPSPQTRQGHGDPAARAPPSSSRLETKRAIEADRTVADVLEIARERIRLSVQRGRRRRELGARRQRLPDRRRRRRPRAQGRGRRRRRPLHRRADGTIVDDELDERTVGLTLDELRSARVSIVVIAGRDQARRRPRGRRRAGCAPCSSPTKRPPTTCSAGRRRRLRRRRHVRIEGAK